MTNSTAPVLDAKPFASTLSTVRATLQDGTVHIINNAVVAGVWSSEIVIQEKVGEAKPGSRMESWNIHTHPAADIARLEVDTYADDMSYTRDHLDGPGYLGFDDELDLDGERTKAHEDTPPASAVAAGIPTKWTASEQTIGAHLTWIQDGEVVSDNDSKFLLSDLLDLMEGYGITGGEVTVTIKEKV